MKLKDILEIGTYGFNPECEDSILIAMTEESEEADEN